MTIRELISEASIYGPWYEDDFGFIRNTDGESPMAAVARCSNNAALQLAIDRLDMRYGAAYVVFTAEDRGYFRSHFSSTRKYPHRFEVVRKALLGLCEDDGGWGWQAQ